MSARNKEHQAALAASHYAANSADYKARTKDWKAANPQSVATANRKQRLKRYGLTPDSFNALLQAQGTKCAICRSDLIDPKSTHVDHCHATGKVRGILCQLCNVGVGHFRNDPALLVDAAAYLMENS